MGMNWKGEGVLASRSIHSEEEAWYRFKTLRKNRRFSGKWLRKGVTMVNIAVTRAFHIRIAKPCSRCAELIQKQGGYISRIYWTTGDGDSVDSACHTHVHHGTTSSSGDRPNRPTK